MEPIEHRITFRPAIAFATAALDRALPLARKVPRFGEELDALVRDLWAWQGHPAPAGRENMSLDEARALPSNALLQRLADFESLRAEHAQDRQLEPLFRGVVELFRFIIWLVDGVERLRNRFKPDALGPGIGDEGWDDLINGLEALARASRDRAREQKWQEATVARLLAEHGMDPDDDVIGEELTPEYFRRN
jgi:hypothetical protein